MTIKLDLDMNNKVHVVDGGWLLHQVKWTSGAPIKTIVTTYVNYVRANSRILLLSLMAMGRKHH